MKNRVLTLLLVLLCAAMFPACLDLITGPTGDHTENNNLNNNFNGQQPGASPSPSSCGGVSSLVLGTQGDDSSLTANGSDSVTLVVSYYQGAFELPSDCTKSLPVAFGPPAGTSPGPCVTSGNIVTSTSPGTCPLVATLPGIPPSNTFIITARAVGTTALDDGSPTPAPSPTPPVQNAGVIDR